MVILPDLGERYLSTALYPQELGVKLGFWFCFRCFAQNQKRPLHGEADRAIRLAQNKGLVRLKECAAVPVEEVEEVPHKPHAIENCELDAVGCSVDTGSVLSHHRVDGVCRHEDDVRKILACVV